MVQRSRTWHTRWGWHGAPGSIGAGERRQAWMPLFHKSVQRKCSQSRFQSAYHNMVRETPRNRCPVLAWGVWIHCKGLPHWDSHENCRNTSGVEPVLRIFLAEELQMQNLDCPLFSSPRYCKACRARTELMCLVWTACSAGLWGCARVSGSDGVCLLRW